MLSYVMLDSSRMQENQDEGSSISVNLLKNFNPYEILVPEKVERSKDHLLVDLGDDPGQCTSQNGTLMNLDTVLPKIHPDLIDLFENVLVTPQQIDKRKQNQNYIEEWPDLNDFSEALPNSREIKEVENCFKKDFARTPKIIKPPNLKDIKLRYEKETKSSLMDVSLKHSLIGDADEDITGGVEEDSNSNVDIEDPDNLLEEILQTKAFEMAYSNRNSIASSSKYQPINKINVVTVKNNIAKDVNCTTVNKANIKLLETVKKDDKDFLKRSIKSGAEKSSYTPGPNIYEKSVLLPQMMERLRTRKMMLEDRKKLQRRLILDSGADSPVSMPVELNPTVLMEDCNMQRLLGFRTRELFDKFIRTGKF